MAERTEGVFPLVPAASLEAARRTAATTLRQSSSQPIALCLDSTDGGTDSVSATVKSTTAAAVIAPPPPDDDLCEAAAVGEPLDCTAAPGAADLAAGEVGLMPDCVAGEEHRRAKGVRSEMVAW